MRRILMALAMAGALLIAGAEPVAGQPPDPAALRHCLSHNPRRLALTAEQRDRIAAILRSEPDGPARRYRIVEVLTITQRLIFQDMAGVGAC